MDTIEMRTCTGHCARSLPATREHFYFNPRSTTTLRRKCIRCFNDDSVEYQRVNGAKHAAKQRKWRQENPEAARSIKLKYRYGITSEDYDGMLAAQSGGCAICGSTESKNGRLDYLYVDHCHDTGQVRGLLCYHCNTTLGYMNDDPEVLRAAADYLERHNGS